MSSLPSASEGALKLVVFLSTVREGRNGSRVGTFVVSQLEARGHEVTLFDPAEMPLELLKKRRKRRARAWAGGVVCLAL